MPIGYQDPDPQWREREREPDWAELFWTAVGLVGLAVLVVVLCGDLAVAQENSPLVQIKQRQCRLGQCSEPLWSGVLVGGWGSPRVAVLTCAHGYQTNQPVAVKFYTPDASGIPLGAPDWVEARIRAVDPAADLGLIELAHPEPLAVYAVADSPAQVGEVLVSYGFPAGHFKEKRLSVVQERMNRSGQVGQVEVFPHFELGDSGGPVLRDNRLVGIAVGQDILEPLLGGGWINTSKRAMGQPFRNVPQAGYFVSHQQVCQFLRKHGVQTGGSSPTGQSSAGGPVDVMEPDTEARLGPPEPIYRRKPNPTPVVKSPPEESPAATPPPAKEPTDPVAEVDWSLAHAIVVLKRKASNDWWAEWARPAMQLSTADVGLGAAARRYLQETTGGKIAVTFVYERTQPLRYEALLAATGLKPPETAGVVVLVRQQDSGLIGGVVRKMTLGWVEWAAKRGIKDLPVEIVFERNERQTVADIEAALDVVDDPGQQSWLEVLLAALLPVTWGGDQLTKNYRPRRLSRPVAGGGARGGVAATARRPV